MKFNELSTTEKIAINRLLDLTTFDTGEKIRVGDRVAIYDWGSGDKNILGYGRIVWDSQHKCFDHEFDHDFSAKMGITGISQIDPYDRWRVPMRYLNEKELSMAWERPSNKL